MNTEPMVTDVVSQIGNSSPNNMNLTSDNYANMDHDALMEQLKLLMEQNRNQQAVIQSLRQSSRRMNLYFVFQKNVKPANNGASVNTLRLQ